MERNAIQLLRPLKVIQLGPERQTPLEELPIGAEVRIVRDSPIDDCIDIAYKDKRYFTLKNEILCTYQRAHGAK
jgi:hypothetical protein